MTELLFIKITKLQELREWTAALSRNSRKTERGAKQFLTCFAVRAAPLAD
ncbi:MAG: hypothetical protein WBE37_28895 [Bryobacteraceae bacterium]